MEEDSLSLACSRSQTVPNIASLQTDLGDSVSVRDVSTPDSLLSDTGEDSGVQGGLLTPGETRGGPTPDSGGQCSEDKTPDSCHGKTRKQGLPAWPSQDQESEVGGGDDTARAWATMLDTENETLRDRVACLEVRCRSQEDEVSGLRSSMAECLRRLERIEGDRGHVEVIALTPGLQPAQMNGSGSRIPQRRPMSATTTSIPAPGRRRPSSGGGRNRSRQEAMAGGRRQEAMASHYTSSSSINSETPSQAATPVPPPRLHSTALAPRKLTGSMGKLHKKWRSTSDFDSAPGLSVYKRPSLSFRPGSALGSQLQLQGLDKQQREARDTPQYCSEEGVVRLVVQGRPVSLVCPSDQRLDYSLERVSPAPAQRLKLEWVYGYRGREGRANLHLLPTGEMVYPLAALVVLYNTEEHSQRHYLGHTEDVRCMALHPNRLTMATGQGSAFYKREGSPHIRIWNSVSLATIQVLGAPHIARPVSCLSFSKTDGGVFLAAVEDGPEHALSVWDWAKAARQLESRVSSETVVAVEFHPLEDGSIITCGKGHVNFWQIDASYTSVSRKTGVLDPRDKPKYFTCLAFSSCGDLITGDSSGHVFIWGRGYNAVTKALWGVHEGPVFTVCVLKDGSVITGGGKDRRAVKFDSSYRPTGEEAVLPEALGGVRTLAQAGSGLLLGTTRNSLLQGTFQCGFHEVMSGHAEEVWALAARPAQNQFLTGGHSGVVRLWDSLSHAVIWTCDLGEQVQAAAFSQCGERMAVGTVTGRWMVLDSRTRQVTESHQDGAEPIATIAFSPDGQRLALASRTAVHCYQAGETGGFQRLGRCLAQSPLLPAIDWAEDSIHIAANTADREHVVWDTSLCRSLTSPSLVSRLTWSSSSLPLSWGTLGAWGEGREVTAAAASLADTGLLAVGDDLGQVRLYQQPACQPSALGHCYPGHSSTITRLTFLGDSSRLVTAGLDAALLQWAVVSH